jgi:hypothetical protein
MMFAETLQVGFRTRVQAVGKQAIVWVVGQFAVAAVYERRNLLNQNPAVIDRR